MGTESVDAAGVVDSTTTSGVGVKTATATPRTAPPMSAAGPPARPRGARKIAEASSSASTPSITDAGKPFSPKQPQLPVSASFQPSFRPVVIIA